MNITKNKILAGAAALMLTTTLAVGGLNTVHAQDAAKYDKAFGESVKAYLMDNPEVIMEAIEEYQANQQEIEARRFKETVTQKKDVLHDPDAPFAGNPDGDLVIVEFFDYNCGYCKRAIGDVQTIIAKEKDVKIIFKEMPILSETSVHAARYALAAHKQGKYFDYHVALMEHRGQKDPESLQKIGEDLGLDVKKLIKDADSAEIRAEIEKDLELSRELGIRGTPAFIIGETMSPGYLPYTEMKPIIDAERKAQNDG